jgi:hypothetical protein
VPQEHSEQDQAQDHAMPQLAHPLHCQSCKQTFAPSPGFCGGVILCPFCGFQNAYAAPQVRGAAPPRPQQTWMGAKMVALFGCISLFGFCMSECGRGGRGDSAPRLADGAPPKTSDRAAPPLGDAAATETDEPRETEVTGFRSVAYELVDCRRSSRPPWCKHIKYASKSERGGTVALVLRTQHPGRVHECWSNGERTWYSGHAGEWTIPEAALEKLGARLVTLVPADGRMQPSFFVVPPEQEDAVVREYEGRTLAPCPTIAAEDSDSAPTAGGPSEVTVPGRAVTIELSVDDRKPTGKAWDAAGGSPDLAVCIQNAGDVRCFPGGVGVDRLQGHACADTTACSIAAELPKGAGAVELTVVDVDLAAHDPIANGTCKVGKQCDLGTARLLFR